MYDGELIQLIGFVPELLLEMRNYNFSFMTVTIVSCTRYFVDNARCARL